jgi:hypothetical protein
MIPDWQMNVLNKLQGVKKGELSMITAGRRSGKSMLSSQAFQRLWNDLHARPVENLKLSEGTVYGARYYTVEPVGGSWHEMEHWCHEAFGDPGDKIWDSGPAPLPAKRWYMNNRKFWFRSEQDQLMFVMKWR